MYQAKGERNFHIFYYLTVCLDKQKRKKLNLKMPPQKFNYVNQSGSYTAETHNDQEEFDDMMQAFEELQFSEKEQITLFQTVAAVRGVVFERNIDPYMHEFEHRYSGSETSSSHRSRM